MLLSLIVFVGAATALLGSPGPCIAALLAVGRSQGFARSLPFYASMQVGLAIAAAASVAGIVTFIQAVPVVHTVLMVVASVYLLWLAWSIASQPVGVPEGEAAPATKLPSGFVLAISNPKAYLAFASLFGSFAVLEPGFGVLDSAIKLGATIVVMLTVDILWLWAGAALGRIAVSARVDRLINVGMGLTIVLAWLLSLLGI